MQFRKRMAAMLWRQRRGDDKAVARREQKKLQLKQRNGVSWQGVVQLLLVEGTDTHTKGCD